MEDRQVIRVDKVGEGSLTCQESIARQYATTEIEGASSLICAAYFGTSPYGTAEMFSAVILRAFSRRESERSDAPLI